MKTAPIYIVNHVWIGSKATILKGVTIGDGPVVTKDVPPTALVCVEGPVKVIKEKIFWE